MRVIRSQAEGRDEERRGLCYDKHPVWAVTVTKKQVGMRPKETTMWYRTVGRIVTLTLSLLAAPLAADAQPTGKVWRIGYASAERLHRVEGNRRRALAAYQKELDSTVWRNFTTETLICGRSLRARELRYTVADLEIRQSQRRDG
jgi:hypothetical protein